MTVVPSMQCIKHTLLLFGLCALCWASVSLGNRTKDMHMASKASHPGSTDHKGDFRQLTLTFDLSFLGMVQFLQQSFTGRS